MQIAILGAGFCGLATAWHLLQNPKVNVHLFDPNGIGGGASGIAAGLLHPFVGQHAKLNWNGHEGMAATRKLLEVSSNALGSPVFENTGLMRIAVTEKQKKFFQECASKSPDEVIWQQNIDSTEINSFSGIWIKSALTVNCQSYLDGLWKACTDKGALLSKVSIQQLAELGEFDAIVITTGAYASFFPEFSHLPITQVKGQILEFNWPDHLPPLPCPMTTQAYLIYDRTKNTCLVGSTFERGFKDHLPDPVMAQRDLSPKFSAFFPSLNQATLVNCKAGIRASTPGHLPIVENVRKKYWVLTGMGSRGLLYHAMMAEKLSNLLLSNILLH